MLKIVPLTEKLNENKGSSRLNLHRTFKVKEAIFKVILNFACLPR